MKKNLLIITLVALLISFSSCSSKQNDSEDTTLPTSTSAETTAQVTTESINDTEPDYFRSEYTVQKSSAPISLTNKMTDYERLCVTKRHFTLLDEELPEPDVKIGNVTVTKEATINLYKWLWETGSITEEEYQESIANVEEYSYQEAMLNGSYYTYYIPPKGYDGGRITLGDDITYENKEAYYDRFISDYFPDYDLSESQADSLVKQTKAVFEAVINGTYTELPDKNKDYMVPFSYSDPYADYRSSWEFDSEALSEIKDHIDEYLVYDEQLGLEFLVHCTLPPNYDSAKTYPVFFLTDGVWRLNDHAALYKAMENKEASEAILVSLSYNYNINGTEDMFRDKLFIRYREGLLNFITDDLMPYLGEQYSIDYSDSTLFGHSMGGVFSHYALFNSDKYENQPFFRYIIGSPAMFNLYGAHDDYDAASAESEYGYFDRHGSLDKKVFLCGGSLEDPDYSEAYSGHDSLLTGLKKMKERISSHDADLTYKLYKSHHYQYVPSMLLEFFKSEYPCS